MTMDVSRETSSRLETFAALLTEWNARINLVSPRDLPRLWPRHIEDALQLLPFVRRERLIDLGSGGGFPGLVLGIAAEVPVTLIESDQRKAAFLREAARVCGVRAEVIAKRIEAAEVAPAPLVTARALAPLPRLLEWAVPKLAPGGRCLFLKGKNAPDELTEARAGWQMTVEQIPSRTDPSGVILHLSEISRQRD